MSFPEEPKIIVERKEDGVTKTETGGPSPEESKTSTFNEITSSVRELAKNLPESIGKLPGSIGAVIHNALSSRDLSVTATVSEETLKSIEMLVEAGMFANRAEATAFLIGEGVKARSELFTRVSEKVREIERLRAELRSMTGEPGAGK
jgi:hypothetical protein